MAVFDQHLEKLLEFLRIPSISSLPEYANDMVVAAQFLEKELIELGFAVSFHWPKGQETTPPLVVAQRINNPNHPTVLVYGHYDVQPATPLSAWKSDPFEPVVRDGNIYARGASDDKGQIMTHLAALAELKEEWEENWPLNIKIIFEGQEEQGSPGMQQWLLEEEAQKLLAADVAILCDTPMVIPGVPTIMYGLRGITYFHIDVQGAQGEIHSGTFGGNILNPAQALVYILSQLMDIKTGKILIPGFYDDVTYTEEDRQQLATIPFSEQQFLEEALDAKALWGNPAFTPKERQTIQPTLDINGIWSGDTTMASKTAIPATAHAKFSCRTVANQDPEKLEKLVKDYIQKIAPKEVDVTVKMTERGDGMLVNTNSPWVQKVSNALETVFGEKTVFDREGASIPAVATMQKVLTLEPIMFGYATNADYHVPNEKFSLEFFKKGIEANKLIYTYFAQHSS